MDIEQYRNYCFRKPGVTESIDLFRANHLVVEEPSYLSKKHWSSVLLDSSLSDKQLYE